MFKEFKNRPWHEVGCRDINNKWKFVFFILISSAVQETTY